MKKQKISKPWAVYGGFGNMAIGKIVKISGEICSIKYKDKSKNTLSWTFDLVKYFETSEEAIDYFLDNFPRPNYSKKDLVKSVLSNFPKERKKLEKLLAQSLPKYTLESYRTLGDEIGIVSHPYQ